MSQWWVADSEARVLGPVSLEVLTEAAAAGKLKDVRVASPDGKNFSPLAQFPEVQKALQPRKYEQVVAEQNQAIERLKAWVVSAKTMPFLQLLGLPESASGETVRATFFNLLQRFYPDRLPGDATPALRRACEDAFLALSDKMINFERQWPGDKTQKGGAVEGIELEFHGNHLALKLKVKARDVSMFTRHPELSVRNDGLFVPWGGPVPLGTGVTVTVGFQGHPTPIKLNGRVVAARQDVEGLGTGFGIKLLELPDSDRAFMRAYVARATSR
jgi:hypothetical protein